MIEPINRSSFSALTDAFQSKQPYRYASVGELFTKDVLAEVSKEISEHIHAIPEEKNIYASHRKFKESQLERMPETTRSLVSYLNSIEFIEVLQQITGIDDLHGDPDLLGGGIHAIGRGGVPEIAH